MMVTARLYDLRHTGGRLLLVASRWLQQTPRANGAPVTCAMFGKSLPGKDCAASPLCSCDWG